MAFTVGVQHPPDPGQAGRGSGARRSSRIAWNPRTSQPTRKQATHATASHGSLKIAIGVRNEPRLSNNAAPRENAPVQYVAIPNKPKPMNPKKPPMLINGAHVLLQRLGVVDSTTYIPTIPTMHTRVAIVGIAKATQVRTG